MALVTRTRRRRRAGRAALPARQVAGAALAGRRRTRHGQHARRGDDAALRLAPVAARRAHLRSVVRSFEHDAEVAVRQSVAEQAEADRRRAVLRPRLQQRGLRRRRRAAAARHADRRARPLRVDRVAVGSEEPVRRRRRDLLRWLQAARRQAERRFAAAQARHREDPAARHDRGVARREKPGRQGAPDGRGRARHGRPHRGHAARRRVWRSAASCPATWCGSTPAGATTGRTGDDGGSYYAMAPGLSVDAAKWLATKRIVAIGLDAPFIDAVPSGMLQGKAPPAPGTEPGCRSRSTITCCRCSASTTSRT